MNMTAELFEEIIRNEKIISITDLKNREKFSYKTIELITEALYTSYKKQMNDKYIYVRGYPYGLTESISKYLCVFSQRAYISAGSLHCRSESKSLLLDADTDEVKRLLGIYYLYREIIKNNIAIYVPYSMSIKGINIRRVESENGYTTFPFFDLPQTVKLYNSNYDSFLHKSVSKLYVGLPWLFNARVEDYIEIINKYETQFSNYNKKVREISLATNDIEEFNSLLVKEFQEAVIDIRIALEKKKTALKVKGITTILGICMTTIPYICPQISQYVDPKILSALLGGNSIKDLLSCTNDINEIANLCKENPFWPLWEWQRRSEHTYSLFV